MLNQSLFFVFSLLLTLLWIPSSGIGVEIFDLGRNKDRKWSQLSTQELVNKKILLQHLSLSPTGKALIDLAIKKSGTRDKLIDNIIIGETSLTDKTLTRKFSSNNVFNIHYQYRAKIYINRDLNMFDATLDLAHELVHYIHKDFVNLYDRNMNPFEFIRSTLEDKGGEIQAYMVECKVLSELHQGRFLNSTGCQSIRGKGRAFSRRKATAYFYHLGNYKGQFLKELKGAKEIRQIYQELPNISDHPVKFYSAAYSLPYPLAAVYEYQAVLKQVCENERKRIQYGQLNSKDRTEELESALIDVKNKCQWVVKYSTASNESVQ
jgi:hypothetical protein